MKLKYFYCNNKIIIRFIFFFALISFIIGIVYYYNLSPDIKNNLINRIPDIKDNIINNRSNSIIIHLGILSTLLVLSILLFGGVISLFYYAYEFMSLGYLFALLYEYRKFKGILFSIIYSIINKGVFLLILSLFLLWTIKYIKNILNSLKRPKKDLIISYLIKSLIIISLICINDLLIYLFGNYILKIFLVLV